MADTADLKSADANRAGPSPAPGTKSCSSCRKLKSFTDFDRRTAGFTTHCKTCRKSYPSRKTGMRRLRRWELSKEQLEEAELAQNNRCSICDEISKLVIDHDHQTGLIRGLICGDCNRGLGGFRDSPETLTKALTYLRNPPVVFYPVVGSRLISGTKLGSTPRTGTNE